MITMSTHQIGLDALVAHVTALVRIYGECKRLNKDTAVEGYIVEIYCLAGIVYGRLAGDRKACTILASSRTMRRRVPEGISLKRTVAFLVGAMREKEERNLGDRGLFIVWISRVIDLPRKRNRTMTVIDACQTRSLSTTTTTSSKIGRHRWWW